MDADLPRAIISAAAYALPPMVLFHALAWALLALAFEARVTLPRAVAAFVTLWGVSALFVLLFGRDGRVLFGAQFFGSLVLLFLSRNARASPSEGRVWRKLMSLPHKRAAAIAVAVAILGLAAFWFSGPRSYEDCILNGMEGISSERAARAIDYACRQKFSRP